MFAAISTPAEVQDAIDEYAGIFGVSPDRVLMTRFGIPPMVKPLPGTPDGKGRIPPELTPAGAFLPNLWLDQQRLARPDETVDHWVLRTAVLLDYVGYYDWQHDAFVDPLYAELGIDIIKRDDDWERVQRYMKGGEDVQLQRFYISSELSKAEMISFDNKVDEIMQDLLMGVLDMDQQDQESVGMVQSTKDLRDTYQQWIGSPLSDTLTEMMKNEISNDTVKQRMEQLWARMSDDLLSMLQRSGLLRDDAADGVRDAIARLETVSWQKYLQWTENHSVSDLEEIYNVFREAYNNIEQHVNL
jgi:hypothetical protein